MNPANPFGTSQVPIIQDLQLPAQGSGLAKISQQFMFKIVIQLNICHDIQSIS